MCKCREDIEKKLLVRFKEQNPNATEHSVTLTGYALFFGESEIQVKGFMPIESTALFTLKNGGSKRKKSTQSMAFNYCPFCGEGYENDKAVKKAEESI